MEDENLQSNSSEMGAAAPTLETHGAWRPRTRTVRRRGVASARHALRDARPDAHITHPRGTTAHETSCHPQLIRNFSPPRPPTAGDSIRVPLEFFRVHARSKLAKVVKP